jgi:uncharacterized protein YndB with AHSA1/START domain
MLTRSTVVHSTFTIERTYPAAPSRVFAAFASPEIKRRWFTEGDDWKVDQYTLDFRVGGRETAHFRFTGSGAQHGAPIGNDTVYLNIVPDQRIVFAYTMTVREQHISASLATVEIAPASDGSRLVFTEQAAFFDGADQVQSRESGWGELLERLDRELRKPEER